MFERTEVPIHIEDAPSHGKQWKPVRISHFAAGHKIDGLAFMEMAPEGLQRPVDKIGDRATCMHLRVEATREEVNWLFEFGACGWQIGGIIGGGSQHKGADKRKLNQNYPGNISFKSPCSLRFKHIPLSQSHGWPPTLGYHYIYFNITVQREVQNRKISGKRAVSKDKYQLSWLNRDTPKMYPNGWKMPKMPKHFLYRQSIRKTPKKGCKSPPHFWNTDFPEDYVIPTAQGKFPPKLLCCCKEGPISLQEKHF